ncbi:MAG: amino acid ABC transporter substrate-binding protein [Clostridiales bacterium]|nr:amino acid ABC transporter substrate-binding protein [Clostridiales bacterium]
MRRWRNKMAVAVMAIAMIGTLAGCGGTAKKGTTREQKTTNNQTGEDTSLSLVQQRGEFILGLDASFPPMGFTNEKNEIVGYDIDLAKEVCERMGVELKIQPINWDSKQQELDTKNIDCIWNGFTVDEERKKSMTVSDAYMENHQVLVVKADSSYKTKEDLAGKVVELQKGSTAAAALDSEENKEFKDSLADTILIADNVKAMMDLGTGCDAVLMDEVVANYYLAQNEGKYRILEEALSDEEYVIGFRKGEEALKDEVENQLKAMVADGTMSEIDNKWFGKDVSTIANEE